VEGAAGAVPEAALSIAAWARDALASLTERPAVRRAGLALAEGGGRSLRFTASDREHGRVEWCHVDAYEDVPLNTVVRTGEPALGALDDLEERYPDFIRRQRDTATVALAAQPIVAAGQTLGGFVLFFDRPQAFDAGQRRELAQAGAALGAALRRAQRAEERPALALADEPPPPGAVFAAHEVTPDPAYVGDARRFLEGTLHDWGIDEETTYTAVLCLSELVTNALIHANAGCTVRVLLDGDVLTTTVRDGGTPDVGSVEPLDDPFRVHGRGLQVVDALATRWGSELDAVGTTVWFVLELEGRRPRTR
jgi:anti-sigma regulatory factor (Ser/Thr protein kinase)